MVARSVPPEHLIEGDSKGPGIDKAVDATDEIGILGHEIVLNTFQCSGLEHKAVSSNLH